MRKEHLDNIRNYLVDNIIRNPEYLFSDEIRGKEDDDIDLLTVIASLYEELHHEVTGEDYNYFWHFANKYGAYVDDKLFVDLKEGDAISRQAAIDALTKTSGIRGDALKALYELPSVTPQQSTGRWIKTRLDDEPDKICDDCGTYCWKCSICGSDASGWGNYKYCPKCGAKMEVAE